MNLTKTSFYQLCLCALLFGVGTHYSNAQDLLVEDYLKQELEVAEPEISETQDQLFYEIKTKKDNVYFLRRTPEDELAQGIYYSLNTNSQAEFQKNRLFILGKFASVMEKTELVVGFVSVIKSKLKNIFKKKDKGQTVLGVLDSREKGHEVISRMIEVIDRRLWLRAPVVATQNEFAFTLGVSALAMAGHRKVGVGTSLGLMISMGFNRQTRKAIFEITLETQKFSRAWGVPTLLLAIAPRGSISVTDQRPKAEMDLREGRNYYPPLAAGYFFDTEHHVEIGAESHLLSCPPLYPMACTFMTKVWRLPALRITVSPLTKGFVRVLFPGFMTRAVANEVSRVQENIENASELIKDVYSDVTEDCGELLEGSSSAKQTAG